MTVQFQCLLQPDTVTSSSQTPAECLSPRAEGSPGHLAGPQQTDKSTCLACQGTGDFPEARMSPERGRATVQAKSQPSFPAFSRAEVHLPAVSSYASLHWS